MDYSLFQIVGGVLMLAVVIGLVFAWRRYQASNSERRMLAMLESAGLDPAIVASGDFDSIINDIRRSCRSCQSEDVCERWLKGEEKGGNEFCPNSGIFELIRKHGITEE